MSKTKKSKLKKVLLIISIFIIVLFLSCVAFVTIVYNKYDLDINKLTSLNNGVRVYSASGQDNTLYNTNRSIITIDTLPEYVKNAFIDTEDKRFYSHNGYDIKRIIKAGFVNMTTNSKSQGASTISQQLIKNALLSNEKTYSRKIKEIVLSIKMEKNFTKDEILEMYLNTIYFGSNAYGIENASKVYFNKSANDLTINEACCLAGLIKSPNTYSPKTNYEKSVNRKNLVANAMYEAGHITEDEYNEVVSSGIKVAENIDYDHSFEEEAIYEACRLLNISERELINKKYQIYTFKDDVLQQEIIKINNENISTSEKTYDTPLDSVSVIASNDGKVLAYYANSYYNLHNMKRQPASTFKPLAVYLPCIIHNILTPATTILDEEINYNGFSPKNADNKYHGYVSVRDAVSQSLNIPAVKALEYLGYQKSKSCLNDFGIDIENSDLNLSLALGSLKNGVSLLSLVSAYSTIANLGNYYGVNFVDKILDENGKVIYSYQDSSERVFDEKDCFLMTDMLKDTAKTGTAKRLNSLNMPVASKTGTASYNGNNTDLYNVSYTTEHTILTWIADLHDNTLPQQIHSSIEPTQINKEILQSLYANKSVKDFKKPDGVEKYPYDLIELEENHILSAPAHDLERYIAYDYFKTDNAPIAINFDQKLDMTINLDKSGAIINFKARKNKTYNLYKIVNGNETLLRTIKEQSGDVNIVDSNIFKDDQIEYYILDNQNNRSNSIEIRPKDYIMNYLNSQIISGKKKWYV